MVKYLAPLRESMSKALYNRLGYSGNVSRNFRILVNELIDEGIIKYEDNTVNNSLKSM